MKTVKTLYQWDGTVSHDSNIWFSISVFFCCVLCYRLSFLRMAFTVCVNAFIVCAIIHCLVDATIVYVFAVRVIKMFNDSLHFKVVHLFRATHVLIKIYNDAMHSSANDHRTNKRNSHINTFPYHSCINFVPLTLIILHTPSLLKIIQRMQLYYFKGLNSF